MTEAYDFFNERLFAGRLPRCLITMQRQRGASGYFAGKRFGTKDGAEVTDEIALNPAHFSRDHLDTRTVPPGGRPPKRPLHLHRPFQPLPRQTAGGAMLSLNAVGLGLDPAAAHQTHAGERRAEQRQGGRFRDSCCRCDDLIAAPRLDLGR